MAKAKPIKSAGGVGESKVFIAPAGSFEDNPILNLHVGGVLVKDLPVELHSRIVYAQTDEGIEENNKGKVESAARVGAGPEDKALQERRHQIKEEGYEPYLARDMMKELHDKFVAPGMRGKFLSPKKVKENGGTGDYVVVNDPDTGQPVSYKGMILGQMPEKRARARNKYYQDKSREMLRENDRQFKQAAAGGGDAIIEK
jgi:hypothetical protein